MSDLPPEIHVQHLAGYARRMTLPHMYVATTHRHNADHWTVLERGSVLVALESGWCNKYIAPAAFMIRAGEAHRIEALTDNVVCLCVHTFPIGSEEADALGVTMDHALVQE